MRKVKAMRFKLFVALSTTAVMLLLSCKTTNNNLQCKLGEIGVTSSKGARCVRLVAVPSANPEPQDEFVACPYPQRFSTCHGTGNWSCGSQNGVRGCWQ